MAEAAIAPAPSAAPPPAAQPSLPSGIPQLPPSTRAGSNMSDSFARLESFAREPGTEEKPADSLPQKKVNEKREAKKSEAAKVESAKAVEEVEDGVELDVPASGEKHKEVAQDANKPGELSNKPKKPGDFLREAYAKEKAEREKLQKEIEALKSPKEDPEKLELKTKYEAAEKKAIEREERLRQVEYEKSDEYSEKFLKPYQDALALGLHKVKSFDVVEQTVTKLNPDTGENETRVLQKERPATDDDFLQICREGDDREARKLAKWKFGSDANEVMAHREKVLEANRQRHGALEDFKKNGAEREKIGNEQRAKQQKEFADFQAKLRETHYPKWAEQNKESVTLDETDTDGKSILERDRSVTDKLFSQDHGFSKEKQVELHAAMRNRAAHYGVVQHKLKLAQKQISEMAAKLKGYEESEPGEGTGNQAKSNGAPADTMRGVLDSMDKYGEARAPRLM